MADRITKAEQYERTRRALLDAARELFAEQGYANTSTEEIVSRARSKVTRGAVYYHFRDKAGLFEAVYNEEQQNFLQFIAGRVQDADAERDLWQRLVVTTCYAFVERAADPHTQRILHIDGPAVLGRTAATRTGPGLKLARQMFEALVSVGLLKPLSLDPLISLLWALFFEAGVYIANAADTATAQKDMLATMLEILDGLRVEPRADMTEEAGI